ncbi:hypothetical protein HN903_01160 [archaeon]|jgi:hypothetical protein|nr:hypothetical protein [archaeon]MBT7128340.1 hypothetical protein [archaeon]
MGAMKNAYVRDKSGGSGSSVNDLLDDVECGCKYIDMNEGLMRSLDETWDILKGVRGVKDVEVIWPCLNMLNERFAILGEKNLAAEEFYLGNNISEKIPELVYDRSWLRKSFYSIHQGIDVLRKKADLLEGSVRL